MANGDKKLRKDYFISYTHVDRSWAKWIAWQLNEAGYSTILQEEDFVPGSHFIAEMRKAIAEAEHTIAILSPEYLKAPFAEMELNAVLREDPLGQGRKLLPIRVKEFELKEILAGIVYIDLFDTDEATSVNKLLNSVKNDHANHNFVRRRRSKTNSGRNPPPFPGRSLTIKNCPHNRNQLFTGREEFLKILSAAFERERSAPRKQPVAISGLAGIGKTQIALEYAHLYLNRYRLVVWVGAASHDMLSAELATIARLLNLSKENVKEQELAIAAVKHYLKEQSDWLLILDGVEDIEVVKDFVSLAQSGHILLTTQNSRIHEIAQRIELEKMPLDEGALFLLRRAGIIPQAALLEENSENTIFAKDISFELDGLPLALDHAGAYIGQTECGLEGYLKRYRALRPELLLFVPHPETLSVARTFTLSFEKVRDAHRASAELLLFCAFLHPDTIPEEIITNGASELGRTLGPVAANRIKLDLAIGELLLYSLVHRNHHEETLTIHGLVQTILKDTIMRRDERKRWAVRTVRIVSEAFPEVEHSTWSLCQKYLPHALRCAALITEWDMTFIEGARLLFRVGQYLLERAQYSQANVLLSTARDIYEKNLGAENIQVAYVLDSLGYLYMQQGGKYAALTEAELYYRNALAIRTQALGPEDPITAQSLSHLGLLLYNKGNFPLAEPLYLSARTIQEQAGEKYVADLAITLNNLGWLYYNMGDFDKVKPLFEEALAIQRSPEGSESPAMATTINALGMYYRSTGHDEEAEASYRQALAIRERVFGRKHPAVATTLNDLAWLYRTQCKFAQAHEYYKQALSIREQTLGPNHPHVATTLSDIATLYMDQGNYVEAEKRYVRVLSTRESTLGPEHPNVGTSLYNIGWLYFHRGRYAQAEPSHKRALEIWKKNTVKENLLHVARSINALSEVYRAQGRYAEAEQSCLQALEIREGALEPTHRNVITSIGNLANIYTDLGRYEEAQRLYEKALALRQEAQGGNLPRMTVILSNLAKLFVEQGRYNQAESLYKQAWELYEKVLDEQHPDVLEVINSLGLLYILKRELIEAESYLDRALDGGKTVFGPDHPFLGQTHNSLGLLYYIQGKYEQADLSYRRALVIYEKALGQEHPLVAQTYNNLGLLSAAQERYTTAQFLLQRSLAMRRKAFDSPHPSVAQNLNDLAKVYFEQVHFAQAKPLYEEALKIAKSVLRQDHPYLATIMLNYAAVLRKMGRANPAQKIENSARVIQAQNAQD